MSAEDTASSPDAAPNAASAASPPRKPPTAVGTGEWPSQPEQPANPLTLADLVRIIAGQLFQPIHEQGFNDDTQRALRDAGVRTVADLICLPEPTMRRIGVDAATRAAIVALRRSLRMRTRRGQ